MRVDSGVAGEGRVVGVPKFHSWGKCTMPLTNIDSDWMSNASSGLCIILLYYIILYIYIIYAGPLSCILGCNYYLQVQSYTYSKYVSTILVASSSTFKFIIFGIILRRCLMYFWHFAVLTVLQNFVIPSTSSCFEVGLTTLLIYSFNSCHKFSIGLA